MGDVKIMDKNILKIRNLVKQYDNSQNVILKGIDLDLNEEDFLCILGPSGRFFGYRRHGAPAGHYHLFQAGGAGTGGDPCDAAGHPWPCRLFRRNGADAASAGLRRAGDLRH